MYSDPPRWRKKFLPPALLLLTVAGGYLALVSTGHNPESGTAATREPENNGTPPREEPAAIPRDRADRDQPVQTRIEIEDGGTRRQFVLAMDEIYIRNQDGTGTLRPLQPPATPATYGSRIQGLPERDTILPVVYPEGEEPSAANRRFLTSSVLVEAEAAVDPSTLPSALGLPLESLPEASPRHVVVAAASPLAALDGMGKWRNARNVRSAEILLARQQTTRAMPNDPLVGNQWHFKYQNQPGAVTGTDLNIEGVWNYPSSTNAWRGAGVRVGIVDDGLQTGHPDLAANVDTANDKDWNGNDNDPNPAGSNNHGTACAGNAGAVANNGVGVAGSAPESTLVGLRLIAAVTTDAQEAEAMSYLNDYIQVKSNSWGPSDTGTLLEAPGTLTRNALANATATGRGGRGTIILWAGGNGAENSDNVNYDGYANSIHTIAIGAVDSQSRRSYYSEPGACLIVSAPSNGSSPALGITTVDRTGSSGYNTASSGSGGDYTSTFGGTSSATPTAAGVVALMLQRNPNLGWRDVQEILIRSAKKINPANSGWATNGAGFNFHHDFGAGLIDASAAVTMAATWTNLPAATSTAVPQNSLSVAIPDSNANGILRTFPVTANLRAEQVTVRLSISHTSRGNLEMVLTSPSGMTSRLTEVHGDTNDNYSDWTLMTTRHWGETSAGSWTLRIADRSTASNSGGGTLTSVVLTIHGTPAAPANPPPVVAISSPASGAIFGPGSTVDVTVNATDTVAGGGPGTVSELRLYDNGVLAGTRTAAPYNFTITPAIGNHSLFAHATDSEGASADSSIVAISLANRPPVITAATLGAAFAYDDTATTVTGVVATDPDGTTPSVSYQWQSSADGVVYADVPGLSSATLPAAPTRSGLKWRCALTASDGSLSGPVFLTGAVNLLDRPALFAVAGTSYVYQSGLVLRGDGAGISRDAIINEFSQGPAGRASEWIEILTLRLASLRQWSIEDASGNRLTFTDSAVWDNIPAGTRIVVYNSASRDALLPADDTDLSDGSIIVSSGNAARFFTDSWPGFGNAGDSIQLNDTIGESVASLGYGNNNVLPPNVGAVGASQAAYYAGATDSGANEPENWVATSSLVARALEGVTPGKPNTPENAAWITDLRNGSAGIGTSYRLGTGSSLPPGLSLDVPTGLISGTIASGTAGSFNVIIERYNSLGETVSQSFTLEISPVPVTDYATWVGGFAGLPDAGLTADPDRDGIPNLLEYYLGLAPDQTNADDALVISRTETSLSLTYQRSRSVTGVQGKVEASDVMAAATWSDAGILVEILEQTTATQTVKATLALAPGDASKFLRLTVTKP